MPMVLRPAAAPKWCRVLSRHGSSNGAGYLEPAEMRALAISIFFVIRSLANVFVVTQCRSRQPHHFQQHRFAGIDQTIERDAMRRALAPRSSTPREQRDMHEGRQRRAAVLVHSLDRAPAQIVAEIAAGVARGPRIEAGGVCRPQQFCGMRSERAGVDAVRDRSLPRPLAVGIGERRGDSVARPGLDADMRGAAGEAERQQRLRAMPRDDLRSVSYTHLTLPTIY